MTNNEKRETFYPQKNFFNCMRSDSTESRCGNRSNYLSWEKNRRVKTVIILIEIGEFGHGTSDFWPEYKDSRFDLLPPSSRCHRNGHGGLGIFNENALFAYPVD